MQQRASGKMIRNTCMAGLVMLLVSLFVVGSVTAQTNTGIIRGQVTDPSGATVVGATVLLTTPSGGSMDTTTNKEGIYEFKELPPGKYEVKVVATGFGQFDKPGVAVATGQTARVDAALTIQVQQQTVEVTGSTAQVDVNPANNANAIVIQGKDLDALSDDPDELESQLQALAGPSAGPNGGQIYIDGFTAGQLPD
jgi:ABC-type Na+ efflux pump permease subunit